MKKILLILFLLLNPLLLCAEEPGTEDAITQATIDQTNEVLHRVYKEILAAKLKYKELALFDENVISKNEDGFYTIHYQIEMPSAGGKTSPYAFALSAVKPQDKIYRSMMGYFTYPMKAIGIQFSGYLIKHPLRRQYDLQPLVDKAREEMVDYQQQFIPLRLSILPTKESYQVGELIEFKVVLANVSKQNVLVKSLTDETLFFTLNNQFWGTDSGIEKDDNLTPRQKALRDKREARKAKAEARIEANRKKREMKRPTTARGVKTKVGERIILRSDEVLTLDMIGEGYKKPQDIEIRGTYQLNIKGVQPTAKIILRITPPPESSTP